MEEEDKMEEEGEEEEREEEEGEEEGREEEGGGGGGGRKRGRRKMEGWVRKLSINSALAYHYCSRMHVLAAQHSRPLLSNQHHMNMNDDLLYTIRTDKRYNIMTSMHKVYVSVSWRQQSALLLLSTPKQT